MSGASLGWAVLLWSVAWLTPAQAVPIEVAMQTSIGEIHIALDADRAPITVGNFLRYVDAKRFDGITIYRAVKIDEEGKYGLVQVSPTSSACTPNAAQLRTSAPRFSALDRPSTAASKCGVALRTRIASSGAGIGTFPTARSP